MPLDDNGNFFVPGGSVTQEDIEQAKTNDFLRNLITYGGAVSRPPDAPIPGPLPSPEPSQGGGNIFSKLFPSSAHAFGAKRPDLTFTPSVQQQMTAAQIGIPAQPISKNPPIDAGYIVDDMLNPKNQPPNFKNSALAGMLGKIRSKNLEGGSPDVQMEDLPQLPSNVEEDKKPKNKKITYTDAKKQAPEEPQSNLEDIDLGSQGFDYKNNLLAAQDAANLGGLFGNLGKAGSIIGSSIAKVPNNPEAMAAFDSNIKQANKPLEEFAQQADIQKKDPNSPLAKAFKQYAKNLGINLKGDFSAEDAEKFMPTVLKAFEAEQNRQAKDSEIKYKYDQLREMKREHDQIMVQNKKDKDAAKKENDFDKAMGDVGTKIEQTKSRGVVKNAYESLRLVSNAQSLLDEYKDNLDKMPQAQVALFAQELSKIAKGGVAGHSEFKEVMPSSTASKFEAGLATVLNKPTGAHLASFLKEYQPYLKSLDQNARKIIGSNIDNLLTAHKKRLRPEDFDTLTNQYGEFIGNMDKYKPKAAPTAATGPKASSGNGQAIIQKFMMNNPGTTVDEAIDVLTKKGYLN